MQCGEGMKYDIVSGEGTKSVINTRGAHVEDLHLLGECIIRPSPDGKPTHGGAATLIPYANRVRNAIYEFNGSTYHLPENNGKNSIHGLLLDKEWTPVSIERDSIRMLVDLSGRGYPSSIHCETGFSVSSDTFTCSFSITNTGQKECPLVVGSHPYFMTAGTWEIRSEEEIVKLEYEDGYFPTGRTVPVESGSLSPEHGITYDNCFRGTGTLFIRTGYGTLSISRTNMPFFVVYNGEYAGGESVAIEPMTGAPDAFNNGIGLVVLKPGKEYKCGYSVTFNNETESSTETMR